MWVFWFYWSLPSNTILSILRAEARATIPLSLTLEGSTKKRNRDVNDGILSKWKYIVYSTIYHIHLQRLSFPPVTVGLQALRLGVDHEPAVRLQRWFISDVSVQSSYFHVLSPCISQGLRLSLLAIRRIPRVQRQFSRGAVFTKCGSQNSDASWFIRF